MAKLTPAQAKNKADKLFSQYIRAVGYCEKCGKRPPEVQLQCAHWISRRYGNTRCDPDNAFSLCAGCHHWFGANPSEFHFWAFGMRGQDTYDRLFDASQKTSKVDWIDQVRVLTELLRGVA